MKRIVCFAALTILAMASMTAFADSTATYTGSDTNKANVTDTGSHSTVLITKVPDNADQSGSLDASSIVYINQESSTFAAAANFLIKANPAYGKYKVQLGSSSADMETTYFYIGVDTPSGDTAMTRVGEELANGTYKVGYSITVTPEIYNACNSLKIAYDSGATVTDVNAATVTVGGYNLKEPDYPTGTVASGSGDINLAFQINEVPAAYKDSITVYLIPNTVGSEKLNSAQQGGNGE